MESRTTRAFAVSSRTVASEICPSPDRIARTTVSDFASSAQRSWMFCSRSFCILVMLSICETKRLSNMRVHASPMLRRVTARMAPDTSVTTSIIASTSRVVRVRRGMTGERGGRRPGTA